MRHITMTYIDPDYGPIQYVDKKPSEASSLAQPRDIEIVDRDFLKSSTARTQKEVISDIVADIRVNQTGSEIGSRRNLLWR